jgi:hypothetical protein
MQVGGRVIAVVVLALTGALATFLAATLAGWSNDGTLSVVGAYCAVGTGMAIGVYFALSRLAWRRKLAIWGAATAVFVVAQFFTTAWPSRYDNSIATCNDRGWKEAQYVTVRPERGHRPGIMRGPTGHIQRLPPGVECIQPTGKGKYFLPADAISWLALIGYSAAFGFVTAVVLVGLQSSRLRRGRSPNATAAA